MRSSSHLITLIILCLIYATSSQSPSCLNQCSTMKYFGCQICYQLCQLPINPSINNETASFSFHFQSCRQRYCASYSTRTYTLGNQTHQQTYCSFYDWKYHNESQCTQQCCNRPQYRQFTNQTFDQCVTVNEELYQNAQKIGIIIGIVFGGILGLALLIFLVVCCWKAIQQPLSKCFNTNQPSSSINNQNISPYLQNQVINISSESFKQDNLQNKEAINVFHWVQTESNMEKSVSEYCSICLDGKMNCQTSCGHKFHLMCFQDWIRKNPDCPLCKNKNFNDMKIYCQKCKHRQSSIRINASMHLSCMNGNMITCDECMEKGNLEVFKEQ